MTIDISPELILPCPLCGEKAELKQNQTATFVKPRFWVKCYDLDCGCTTNSEENQEKALAKWNRRAVVPAASEQVCSATAQESAA